MSEALNITLGTTICPHGKQWCDGPGGQRPCSQCWRAMRGEIERLRTELADAIDTIQGLAEQNITLRRPAYKVKTTSEFSRRLRERARRVNCDNGVADELRAEVAATFATIGDDSSGEATLLDEIRMPLDSCVGEALGRKDNEIVRLQARVRQLNGHLEWIGWDSDGVIKTKAEILQLRAVVAKLLKGKDDNDAD